MNSNTKFNVLRTVLSVGIALLISFGIIFLTSKEPVNAIVQLLTGPLQSQRRFGNVIEAMIPLIFTGVGVSIMFAANEITWPVKELFIRWTRCNLRCPQSSLPSGISSLACILAAGFSEQWLLQFRRF